MTLHTIFGVSPYVIGGIATTLLAVGIVAYAAKSGSESDTLAAPDELPQLESSDSEAGTVRNSPNVKQSSLAVLRAWRELRKQRKMAKQGYVKWYVVGETWPEPKWVKPEMKAGGVPEATHDGDTYLFPQKAMLASEREGAWTVIHQKGNAEPMNLREPDEFALPTDTLDEYLTMRVSASAPSLMDRLGMDIDGQDAVMYAVAAIIMFALIQGVISGGL